MSNVTDVGVKKLDASEVAFGTRGGTMTAGAKKIAATDTSVTSVTSGEHGGETSVRGTADELLVQ